jgi:hypothetical protein
LGLFTASPMRNSAKRRWASSCDSNGIISFDSCDGATHLVHQ